MKTFTEVRNRIAAELNRLPMKEPDKKTPEGLKGRTASKSRKKALLDFTRPLSGLGRIVERSSRRLSSESKKVFHAMGGLMLVGSRVRVLPLVMTRLLSHAKQQTPAGFAGFRQWLLTPVTALAEYVRFREWLGTPLTTLSLLPLVGIWALAIIPLWFGTPWRYLGDTSGFGAILMTALTTARLTMTFPQLAPPSRLREPKDEHRSQTTRTGRDRRGIVLREIEEFFESNAGMGPVETNLKNQAFLMRMRDWQMLQNAIYDTFLKGAPPLLFEMGERLGTSIASDLEKASPKPGVMLSHLEELARASGWGLVSVHGDLSRGTKLTFRVQESPFCSCKSPLENNACSCHLVSGLVAGIAERVYGWPYSSIERSCIRDGHDCCEIVVTQSMAPERPARRWNLSVLFPVLEPWR